MKIKATVMPDVGELRECNIPGAIQVRRRDGEIWGIAFICPCGCGGESYLPSNRAGHDSGWAFSGDDDEITAHPSVYNTGMPCKWHGWLRGGVWTK